jgi:hypothetical protein
MTLMMSDSLKDIVSIGQLTGESSSLTLTFDNSAVELDIFSFTRSSEVIDVLAFASRDLVASVLNAKEVSGTLYFLGAHIGEGKITRIGYQPMNLRDDVHDMLIVHIKRDN